LLLLAVAFLLVRAVVLRAVRHATETVAAREETSGNLSRASRLRTLAGLTRSVILWTLGFIFAVSALSVIGVNVAGIVGTAGVAGLAFGFGAQKLVKDVITGWFLLMEDQYAVGDYVTVNGITGIVEELAMRTTRIRDDEGKLYILSNGDIAQVCNQSRGPVAGSFEVSVAASADPKRAEEVLNTALAAQGETLGLAQAAKVEGITQADAAKTTFRIGFRSSAGHRPNTAALQLREVARRALREADIPLG
jgi:small conductance mechanosensitive channel